MVTSPCSNAMDWPERTEWSISSDGGFRWGLCGLGLRLWRRLRRRGGGAGGRGHGLGGLDRFARFAGAWQRASPGLQPSPGGVRAFGADDVDAATGDGAHEGGGVRGIGGQCPEIDDDRPVVEEVWCPLDLRIK